MRLKQQQQQKLRIYFNMFARMRLLFCLFWVWFDEGRAHTRQGTKKPATNICISFCSMEIGFGRRVSTPKAAPIVTVSLDRLDSIDRRIYLLQKKTHTYVHWLVNECKIHTTYTHIYTFRFQLVPLGTEIIYATVLHVMTEKINQKQIHKAR